MPLEMRSVPGLNQVLKQEQYSKDAKLAYLTEPLCRTGSDQWDSV